MAIKDFNIFKVVKNLLLGLLLIIVSCTKKEQSLLLDHTDFSGGVQSMFEYPVEGSDFSEIYMYDQKKINEKSPIYQMMKQENVVIVKGIKFKKDAGARFYKALKGNYKYATVKVDKNKIILNLQVFISECSVCSNKVKNNESCSNCGSKNSN